MPLRSAKTAYDSVSEAGFDLTGDLGERRLVHHREIGEHLAGDVDLRLLQPRHEARVGHAELAHRGVDARDPERADLALLLPAIAVGVLPRLHQRLLGDAVDVLPAAAEPLRLLEDFLVARTRRYASLDSWHGAPSARVRQHAADRRRIGMIDRAGAAQLALRLRLLLGEDVAPVG